MGCGASVTEAPASSTGGLSSSGGGGGGSGTRAVSTKAQVDENGKPTAIPTDAVSALEASTDEERAESWEEPSPKTKVLEPQLNKEENDALASFIPLIDNFEKNADFDTDFDGAMALAEEIYTAYCALPAKVKVCSKVCDRSWGVSMPLGAAFISSLGINVNTPEEEKDQRMLDFFKKYPFYGRMSGKIKDIARRQRARGQAHEPYDRLRLDKWDGSVDYDQSELQAGIAEAYPLESGVKKELFGRRGCPQHPEDIYFLDGPGVVDYVNATLSSGQRFVDPFTQQAGSGRAEGWGFPKNFESMRVFSDDIDPNDIMQGFIGNCWMVSTIATVAAWPQLLRDSFYPKTASPSGCYAVRVAAAVSEDPSKVRWAWVIVDSLFPITDRGQTACANSRDHTELWPMLLEKALAKMHGSYDNMRGGGDGKPLGYAGLLEALTGGPSYYSRIGPGAKDFNTPEKLRNYLQWMKMKGQRLLVTSCISDPADNDKLGLVGNHAYSLLGVYRVPDIDTYLVELRNPWGWHEWKGAWGNSDHTNWMKDNRHKQLARFRDVFDWDKIRDSNGMQGMPKDGQFYMEINDYFKYFGNMTTNKVPFKFDVGSGFRE
mmetsp:Transcript_30050/g.70031  ORF Transcript_30050/g.70031 Transcript_30050/m.70031 type:complete len:602 (-) Transcript_30050:98-1903(-)